MWKLTNLVLALAVCLPCSVLAAPSDSRGPSFIDQGKFAVGIESFTRNSLEVDSDNKSRSSGASLKSSVDSFYAFEIGYMVIPSLQLRLGCSLVSKEKQYDAPDNEEISETSIEPGLRYYVQASPTLFPFATVSYALNLEEYGDVEAEGTEMSVGAGMLIALGGGQGGFAAASLEYVSSQRTDNSAREATETFVGFQTQLILGLFF